MRLLTFHRSCGCALVLSVFVVSTVLASSHALLDTCDPNSLSQFVVGAGTASESDCQIRLLGPNDAFGRVQWTGTLPSEYRVEVTLSRPATDQACDQLGLILGDPVSTGWNGIRVMAMSNPGSNCGAYPFDQSDRVVVHNAADNTVLLLETTTASIAAPLVLRIDVTSTETTVWVDNVLLGSIPAIPPGNTLTLLAWDNDDLSHFDSLTVTDMGTVPTKRVTWGSIKSSFGL